MPNELQIAGIHIFFTFSFCHLGLGIKIKSPAFILTQDEKTDKIIIIFLFAGGP